MKLTINQPPIPVQPPKTITLELTEREFAIIHSVVGSTTISDAIKHITENGYIPKDKNFTDTECGTLFCTIWTQGRPIVGELA